MIERISLNIKSFNNNQLLMRYVLALMVFYSHMLAIYGLKEPSFYNGGHSLGWYAVNGFFIISGVLIAQSYVKRNFVPYDRRSYISVISCVYSIFVCLSISCYYD